LKLLKPNAANNFVGFWSREHVDSAQRPVLLLTLPHVDHPLPAAPSSLIALSTSPGQFDLSWSASSGSARYNVKRSTSVGGPYTVIAASVAGTTFRDTSVSDGTIYYYVVSATNGTGESPDSVIASTTPLGMAVLENQSTGLFVAAPGGVTAGTLDLDDDANVLVVGVYADTSGVTFPTSKTRFGGVEPDGVIQATETNRMTAFGTIEI